MRLVAIARSSRQPEAAARAVADASGLTLAEARMRLAPEAPVLLARLPEAPAEALVAALRRAGLAALSIDARVPTDRDRVVVRSFALDDGGATFAPRAGEATRVPWPEVQAVLRGQRTSRSEVERREESNRLSIGAAVATGGLQMTREVSRTVRSSNERTEQVILVYPRQGRAALLAESEVDFSCLGERLQPSSTANMGELAGRLRAHARGAFHDDRLVRLGRRPLPFVAGGESRSQAGDVTTTHRDSTGSLDVLAEVMRQALAAGLLP